MISTEAVFVFFEMLKALNQDSKTYTFSLFLTDDGFHCGHEKKSAILRRNC